MTASILDDIIRRNRSQAPRPTVGLQVGTVVDKAAGNYLEVELLGSEPVPIPALPGNYVLGGAVNVQWDTATDRPLLVYGPAEGGGEGDGREVVTVGGSLAGDREAREKVEQAREHIVQARLDLDEARKWIDETGVQLEGRIDAAEGAVAATGDLLTAIRDRVGHKRWVGEEFEAATFTVTPLGEGRLRLVSNRDNTEYHWALFTPGQTPVGASGNDVVVTVPVAGVWNVELEADGDPDGYSIENLDVTVTAPMLAADYGWADMEWPDVDWGNAEIAISQLRAAGVLDPDVLAKLYQDVVVSGISVATEAFIGGNAILEGSVQAAHITASESMWAKLAAFVRVTTDMLLVGAMNRLPDPHFADPTLTEGRRTRSSATEVTGGLQTTGSFYFVPSTAAADVKRYAVPVTPGERYRVEIPSTGFSPSTVAQFETWNASGTGRVLRTGTGWFLDANGTLSYECLIPSGVAYMSPVVQQAAAYTVRTGARTYLMADSRLLVAGAVTAEKLNVVSTSGTGHSWRLDENGFVAMHNESQKAMHLDAGGQRFWDAAGNLTVRLDGVNNQIAGRLMSGREGARGVIIAPTTGSSTIAGIWFANSLPTQSGSDPAIWVEGPVGAPFPVLNIRAGSGGGGATIALHSSLTSTQHATFGSLTTVGEGTVGGQFTYNGTLRSTGTRHSLEDKPAYLRVGIDTIAGGRPAVFANSDGRIDVASSSERYKVNVNPMPLDYAARVLDVQPVTYYARRDADGLAELLARQADGETITEEEWRQVEYLRPFPGVLAEDVAASGLEEFVFYTVDPTDPDDPSKWVVDGVRYAEMVAPLIVLTRDHRDRITALESRLAVLEGTTP